LLIIPKANGENKNYWNFHTHSSMATTQLHGNNGISLLGSFQVEQQGMKMCKKVVFFWLFFFSSPGHGQRAL